MDRLPRTLAPERHRHRHQATCNLEGRELHAHPRIPLGFDPWPQRKAQPEGEKVAAAPYHGHGWRSPPRKGFRDP